MDTFWLNTVLSLVPVCLLVLGEEVYTDVEVRTPFGRLLGHRVTNKHWVTKNSITDTVDEYLGIPYGKAERWKSPHFHDPWTGLRSATTHGPVCPQISYYTHTDAVYQREDCLMLNVYSPVKDSDPTALYPVMVFVHGGSYLTGSGNRYNGFPLASHGVVVVTINYRLAELGYLSTGDEQMPGNYGLQDQVLGLKWVNKYIEYFRGNASCVTLYGNSAGSSSVGLLMLTNQTQGLYHRIIMQSGSPLSFWAIHERSVDFGSLAAELGELMGCEEGDLLDRVRCMRAVESGAFPTQYYMMSRYSPLGMNFKPRVDGTFITDTPENLFRSGTYHNVPVMTGLMRNEWAENAEIFIHEYDFSHYGADTNLTAGIKRSFFVHLITHIVRDRFQWPAYMAEMLIDLYTNVSCVNDPLVNRENFVEFWSDLAMNWPALHLAELLSHHDTPVYLYLYDHVSDHTLSPWWGAVHSIELDYVFGSPFTGYNIAVDGHRTHSDADRQLSENTMKIWTDFAKNGQPGPLPSTTGNRRANNKHTTAPQQPTASIKTQRTDNPTAESSKWQTFEPIKLNYLYISADNISTRSGLRSRTMHFWNHLFPDLLEASRIGGRAEETIPWCDTHRALCSPYTWALVLVVVILLVVIVVLCVKYCRLRRNTRLTTRVPL